jgi:hypothetical protein
VHARRRTYDPVFAKYCCVQHQRSGSARSCHHCHRQQWQWSRAGCVLDRDLGPLRAPLSLAWTATTSGVPNSKDAARNHLRHSELISGVAAEVNDDAGRQGSGGRTAQAVLCFTTSSGEGNVMLGDVVLVTVVANDITVLRFIRW